MTGDLHSKIAARSLKEDDPQRLNAPAVSPCRRILVADDNKDASDSLAMLLSFEGYEVRVAYDGNSAVAGVRDFLPHVALLDIGMPGLDGYEACKAIRAQTWGSEVCLVALTGWAHEKDKSQAILAGFDHHFTKPMSIDELLGLLNTVQVSSPGAHTFCRGQQPPSGDNP